MGWAVDCVQDLGEASELVTLRPDDPSTVGQGAEGLQTTSKSRGDMLYAPLKRRLTHANIVIQGERYVSYCYCLYSEYGTLWK